MSAKNENGLEELVELIESIIGYKEYKLLIPYDKGAIISALSEKGAILSTEYNADGTLITARLDSSDAGRYSEYIR